jgi:hypothetical protein
MPRDWFELLTKIPVIERIVIKRFVENIMCDQWLKEPHSDLHGLDPTSASQELQSRILLESLLTRMAHNREKTPRQLRRIRRCLGMWPSDGLAQRVLSAPGVHFKVRIFPQCFELDERASKPEIMTLLSPTVLPALPGRCDERFQLLAW